MNELILISYSKRLGIPSNSDFHINVTHLKDPPKYLRDRQTGLHKPIQDAISNSNASEIDAIEKEIVEFIKDKDTCTIGLGCEFGKHRSVAVAEILARRFENCNVMHRDITKTRKTTAGGKWANKRCNKQSFLFEEYM